MRVPRTAWVAVLTVLAALALLGASGNPRPVYDNGLARTPPMGWNDYNAHGLDVTEDVIRHSADLLVTSGLRDAGYVYVNVDDGWMAGSRDAGGNLRADPARFPHGIRALADYVHARGLRLGVYADAGVRTCGGLPGSLGHERQDARQFAAWGVDYLKYDNCYAGPGCDQTSCDHGDEVAARERYAAMRDALADAGRPIVFSLCNWGAERVWAWGPGYGNLWRTTADLAPTYASLLAVFHATVGLGGYAGPGGWNDPDMLEVGNGMTATEDRAELSLWAAMAAPLIAGADLATAGAATLADLANPGVIAVDQDPLGRPARLISAAGGLDVLARPLANGDVAVVLFNETGTAATITTGAARAGAPAAARYTLHDLWAGTTATTTGPIAATVPAHGAAMFRVAKG
ncbi:glycoside hydrolase family 27 protein [Dactylosporangium sp. NPDC048998]|uniref:glycoside hydrolase family 27 protein n=1 Tax=Dactylosporangium sp. NPDC048998 TaxID=3363976 RepID=UPI003717A5A5